MNQFQMKIMLTLKKIFCDACDNVVIDFVGANRSGGDQNEVPKKFFY